MLIINPILNPPETVVKGVLGLWLQDAYSFQLGELIINSDGIDRRT